MLAYHLSVLSCLLSNSFNLNYLHTDLFTVGFFIHTCSFPWSRPFHTLYFPTSHTFTLPTTLWLIPHSLISQSLIFTLTLEALCFVLFVLFCFDFLHTRKRKDIAWYSVSQYLCVIVASTSICFSANGRILFFLLNEWHFFVYVCHTFFVHSSVDKHLSWCHNLAYKNSATINTIMQIVCANFISSGYFARCGIAESEDISVSSYLKDIHTVFMVIC